MLQGLGMIYLIDSLVDIAHTALICHIRKLTAETKGEVYYLDTICNHYYDLQFNEKYYDIVTKYSLHVYTQSNTKVLPGGLYNMEAELYRN